MIKVESKRFRRLGFTCTAAAMTIWGSSSASAQLVNTTVVPADSAYVLSVPDTGAFWSAWEANGVYEIFKNIISMPEVEKNLANFRKELGIVESSLGFKLDGATLSKVFSSAEIYIAVNGSAKEPAIVLITKVADEDKLTKLIDLSEKAALQAAADDDDDDDDDDNDDKPVIVESEHNGFKVKEFKPSDDDDDDDDDRALVYARGEGYLIFSVSLDQVKTVADLLKGTETRTDTLANTDSYKKIASALATNKGEVYAYSDQLKVKEFEGKISAIGDDDDDDDQARKRAINNALNKVVQQYLPVSATGSSLAFQPKQISTYSYGLLRENTSDSILLKHPGDEPIKALGLVPESAILVGATSLIDSKAIYDFVNSAASGMETAAKEAKDDDDDDDDLEEGLEKASKEIKEAEKKVGISIKDDLVPAIGNELAFSINEIRFTGFIPTVDLTLTIGVGDKAKMEKVTTQLEKLAQDALDKKNESAGAADKTTIESEDADGRSIKYLKANGLFGFSPGYVLTDDYLVIGSTKATIAAALKNPNGKNMLNSNVLDGMGAGYNANANVVQYMNFGKVTEIAHQITSSLPNTKEAVKYVEEVQSLDAAATVTRIEDGAFVSRSVLKTK